MYVTSDGTKVPCYNEQYCSLGACNVRSTNQGKLEVVKQEMARVNINILRNSKLQWTEMGVFNSDDHYITTVGKNPLEKWRRNHIQQKSPKCSTWMQSQKQQNDPC